MIVLGLDAENVKRLKEHKPIMVKAADLKIDFNICIAYGDTLAEVSAELGLDKLPRVS